MKTLKNIFAGNESEKSMNLFSDKLDFNEMIMIKGGDGDGDGDNGIGDDSWPPVSN